MDLLITGANGFLGSHLAVDWLLRHPDARVGCLVRGANDEAARERLQAGLRRALIDGGKEDASMLDRADTIRGDMDDPAWIVGARAWLRGPTELLHCAANMSFREADRAAIWRTNVDGTAALLCALPDLPGITAFNYISTAYVAGDRPGDILEGEEKRPGCFNNPYEESKWVAETLVRESCIAAGLPWRILRPSIILAHSVTHGMSSHSGLYRVADTLLHLGRKAGTAVNQSILLPLAEETTLDFIPVDVVVEEVMALLAAGPSTENLTFHLTGSNPLSVADVLREISPMSGVSIEVNGPATPPSSAANVIMRRLRHYMPYFGVKRRFDQRNLRGSLGHAHYKMDIEKLRGFVRSYMERSIPA